MPTNVTNAVGTCSYDDHGRTGRVWSRAWSRPGSFWPAQHPPTPERYVCGVDTKRGSSLLPSAPTNQPRA